MSRWRAGHLPLLCRISRHAIVGAVTVTLFMLLAACSSNGRPGGASASPPAERPPVSGAVAPGGSLLSPDEVVGLAQSVRGAAVAPGGRECETACDEGSLVDDMCSARQAAARAETGTDRLLQLTAWRPQFDGSRTWTVEVVCYVRAGESPELLARWSVDDVSKEVVLLP